MPGRNQWMSALCRTAGFKPRFAVVVDGITNVLSLVASENAVTLLPAYFQEFKHPGVIFVPVSDAAREVGFHRALAARQSARQHPRSGA